MARSGYNKSAAKELLAEAKRMKKAGASWLEVSNALFGPGGPAAQAFTAREEREAFVAGPENQAIREVMASLPMPHEKISDAGGPSGKFLVRLPQSLHAALQAEAEAEGVSLNQLVVAKLAVSLGRGLKGQAGAAAW